MEGPGQTYVAVKALAGGTGIWSEEKLLPGDIIEQVRNAKHHLDIRSKEILQRELRKMNLGERVIVEVRRSTLATEQVHRVELQACVVAEVSVMRRKNFALGDIKDKSHVAILVDTTEKECSYLQDQTERRLEEQREARMSNVQLKDCLLTYSWKKKMQAFLPRPNSAMVFSLLLMPFQSNDVDETSARAMAWLSAAQESGVPIIFVNIQVEPILLQASTSSYFGSGLKENLSTVANTGKYMIQDWKGTDMQIVRAIRLWYVPAAAELAIHLRPVPGEIRVGVGISCTEEGFCYVSSVEHGTSADRAGLKTIFEAACAARKLLVISRIAGEKLTPWMVTPAGAIRCFDTVSISDKLSVHRQACEAIQFYLMVWDGAIKVIGRGVQVSSQSAPGHSRWSNPSKGRTDVNIGQSNDLPALQVNSNFSYSSFIPEFTDDSDSEIGSRIASPSKFGQDFHMRHLNIDSEDEQAENSPSSRASFEVVGTRDRNTRSEDFSFTF
ncbi:hypothetical protein O6H91_08G019400 [Diphasiastrum complanatum]|uniref:Uncharacterized protein n=3 Tax=Diphasiastrum complanatum TaxID=34168 RepID=A0ACC2CD08_DIPCM|nr:hypothetical protein O6H91_11G100400 [Diphasiastrum complanatum]KAJ7539567.1 hypothetical protein O6H91_11G100400 [Diphasiastrum complanatum]KAJ7545994.1 hypothetical protein O6H91_08G019400 [Diphasiastrum complanatum]